MLKCSIFNIFKKDKILRTLNRRKRPQFDKGGPQTATQSRHHTLRLEARKSGKTIPSVKHITGASSHLWRQKIKRTSVLTGDTALSAASPPEAVVRALGSGVHRVADTDAHLMPDCGWPLGRLGA